MVMLMSNGIFLKISFCLLQSLFCFFLKKKKQLDLSHAYEQ